MFMNRLVNGVGGGFCGSFILGGYYGRFLKKIIEGFLREFTKVFVEGIF